MDSVDLISSVALYPVPWADLSTAPLLLDSEFLFLRRQRNVVLLGFVYLCSSSLRLM